MPRDGSETRARLLDAAQGLIFEHGFSATSVDAIIAGAGVTKGAFFHHFPTKTDLAHALVARYAAADAAHLEEFMTRAEHLARDPLQQMLVFVGLFEEALAQLDDPRPGCLFASFCYEAGLFDAQTHAVIRDAIEHWRQRLGAKLAEVAAKHPPRIEVDLGTLADAMFVVSEGAFVLMRTTDDRKALGQQLRHYRNYLELLFASG